MHQLLFIALVTLTLAACNGKSGTGTTGNTGNGTGPTTAACDGHADKVRGLYAADSAARAPADEKPEARALREQEVADNTEMILTDCRRDPARFVPCLQRASSVAEMEHDCVIPLDDQGTVEGDYFNPASR